MITGIEQLTFGVADAAQCDKFLLDWGLTSTGSEGTRRSYETLNGCRIVTTSIEDPALPPAFEPGSTLREVVWSVRDNAALDILRANLQGAPGYADTPASCSWRFFETAKLMARPFGSTQRGPVGVSA